jgi:hypothetical protein
LTVHGGNGEAVVIVTAGNTVTLNPWLADPTTVSVAVTLKLKGVAAATVGAIPLSTPAGDKTSQDGRFALDHVTVPTLPLTVKVWE